MKKAVLYFVLLSCFAAASYAQAETRIIGIEIPGLHEKSGNGVYDKIITKAVVEKNKGKLTVDPPARAENTFSKCTDCCFTPANDNPEFYDFGSDIVKTNPMSTAKIYIFTAKGKPALSSISDLAGKKVGIRLGMPYGKSFDGAGLKTDAARTIEANIKKLNAGRLDAFVAYVPDAYVAFEKMNMEPLPHDKANPIAVHEDCLVCRGVPADFVDNFNKALSEMEKSGELDKILNGQ